MLENNTSLAEKSRAYVTVRADNYISLLFVVMSGALYAVLELKIFMVVSVIAALVVVFTLIRDWYRIGKVVNLKMLNIQTK